MRSMFIFAAVCGGLILSTMVLADAVYLKSGEKIEGNVLQVTDNFAVIQTGAKVMKYNFTQIDRVEQDDEIVLEAGDEEPAEAKHDLVISLLKAAGMEKVIEKNAKEVLRQAPIDQQERLKKLFETDALMELLVPLYAEKFSSQELEKIVNFLNSPAGKKYVVAGPIITEQTLHVLVDYFQKQGAF